MCLANIYQNTKTGEPLMKDVAHIRVDGNRVIAEALMGENQIVSGKITQIDFMNSDVIIKKVTPRRKKVS